MAVLLCTLGGSWAVVPEIYGFVAPNVLDLYRHHPESQQIAEERRRLGLDGVDELWVVTTGGRTGEETAAQVATWWQRLGVPGALRIWRAEDTDGLDQVDECRRMRELIFRACFHATTRFRPDGVVLSLAGGRKTMSADLQQAGFVFGCAGLVHVVDRGPQLPDELRTAKPELFAHPLPGDLAAAIRPVLSGRGLRSPLVEAAGAGYVALQVDDFPLDVDGAADAPGLRWRADERWLVEEVDARQREASRILVGHLQSLLKTDHHLNWISLYRLPPARIDALRETTVAEKHREWLTTLPKPELHLHLGGILDVAAQHEVGRAVWDALSQAERGAACEAVAELCAGRAWPQDWAQRLRHGTARERAARAAAVLTRLSQDELEVRLWAGSHPRRALARSHPHGFAAFAEPGELSGSALLGHEAAVSEYARQAYRWLRRTGVRYAEIRGSPDKYLGGNGALFLRKFAEAVIHSAADAPGTDVRFIVILDRRLDDPRRVAESVAAAVDAKRALGEFLVGFDVAGDEQSAAGEEHFLALRGALEPAFAACLPITIHAGEGVPADRIWSAVYRLHAQRVGHGLTLGEHQELAERLRDRGIALELCPTSNIEVVGFRDPPIAETQGYPDYPLASYWRQLGLPVVVCTDNPGISRTDPANELIRASRMSCGLTLWEVLGMLRCGFAHAFASAATRDRLLSEVDSEIARAVDDLHGVRQG